MSRGFQIEIQSEQSCLPVDAAFLQSVAESVLAAEGVQAADISLALVDNRRIHEINRDFLGHDDPTDVISFLFEESETPEAGRRIEGEIVISAEMARETSARFRWTAQDELVLYLVHGLLHLCGYDDMTDEERLQMRVRERELLGLWKLTPSYVEAAGFEPPAAENPAGV